MLNKVLSRAQNLTSARIAAMRGHRSRHLCSIRTRTAFNTAHLRPSYQYSDRTPAITMTRCGNCGETGHTKRTCPRKNRKRAAASISSGDRDGARDEPQPHRPPPNKRAKRGGGEPYHAALDRITGLQQQLRSQAEWVATAIVKRVALAFPFMISALQRVRQGTSPTGDDPPGQWRTALWGAQWGQLDGV